MDNKLQEQLANIFTKRFEEYNTNTLKKIADTISKFKGLSPTEAHKLAQQLKYDKSYTDLIDELSKLTGQSKKEIQGLLEEVAKENIEFADTFYKARGLQTPIYQENKALQNIVNGIVDLSGSDFINIARSTGFRLLDANNKPLYLDIKETYHKVIDECIYAINQGKDSFDNVMRKTINQLAESGVRKIEYDNDGKAKYSQRIDSAVRRNILDGIRQTTIEVNEQVAKEFDYDGWEITVHSNPAPDHMYVQGHQFTRDEFEKFQSDQDCEDVNGVKFPATSDETGRDRRSIGQYNCYHTAFPIILGVTRPRYTDEQLQDIIDKTNVMTKIDGKEYNKYEVTQLQRQIETEIRKAKDKHIMYKKTGDNLGMLKEQKRITQLENKYKEISKKASLSEQWDRTIVDKYNPLSEKKLENDINKVESIPKTNKNIIKRLKKYNINVSEEIMTEDINKDLANRTLNQIENLVEKYPVLKNKIKERGLYVEVDYMPWTGETNTLGDRMTFSKGLYGKRDKLLSLIKEGQDDNWSSKINKENYDIYTTTHEMGHIVEDSIMEDRFKARNIDIYKMQSESNYETYILRKQEDVDIFNELFLPVSDKTNTNLEVLEKKYISDYGRSEQNYEWFAELFTKMELGEQDIMTKRLKEYLEKELWKK